MRRQLRIVLIISWIISAFYLISILVLIKKQNETTKELATINRHLSAIDSQLVRIPIIIEKINNDSGNIIIERLLQIHETNIRQLLGKFQIDIKAELGKIEGKIENKIKVPGTVYAMLVFGILLFFGGIFVWLAKSNYTLSQKCFGKPKIVALLMITSGILLSIIALLKIFEKSSPEKGDQKTECHCYCDSISSSAYNLPTIMELGPFVSGHDKLPDSLILFKELEKRLRTTKYSSLHIFGGVDNRKTRTYGGENFLLAAARAFKVKLYIDKLKNDDGLRWLDSIPIIVYPAGAGYFHGSDSTMLSKDRSVTVRGVPISQ